MILKKKLRTLFLMIIIMSLLSVGILNTNLRHEGFTWMDISLKLVIYVLFHSAIFISGLFFIYESKGVKSFFLLNKEMFINRKLLFLIAYVGIFSMLGILTSTIINIGIPAVDKYSLKFLGIWFIVFLGNGIVFIVHARSKEKNS